MDTPGRRATNVAHPWTLWPVGGLGIRAHRIRYREVRWHERLPLHPGDSEGLMAQGFAPAMVGV